MVSFKKKKHTIHFLIFSNTDLAIHHLLLLYGVGSANKELF